MRISWPLNGHDGRREYPFSNAVLRKDSEQLKSPQPLLIALYLLYIIDGSHE